MTTRDALIGQTVDEVICERVNDRSFDSFFNIGAVAQLDRARTF